MLAPLKNRRLLERDPAGTQTDLSYLTEADRQYLQHIESESAALASALRLARRNQRRSATLATRKIVAQTNEIARLNEICNHQRQRLAELESGQAIIELGRKLFQLSESNEQLCAAAQRVWYLEKTICAAHAECERLSRERELLAAQLPCTQAGH